ncbi:MAG: ubiquinol-cytochrome c reductase iron-sulfur subunit [Isosphaeraceae bacterium]
MADRQMTLQEKLAAARAGGPAKPEGEADLEARPVEETQPTDVSASAAPIAVAPVPTPAPASTPLDPGRPLTLKEKLAAARAGEAPPAVTAAVAPAPTSEAAPAVPPPAPVPSPSLGRPLTLQEKMAAARGTKPASGAAPAAGAKPAATTAAPAAAQAASTRPLPSLEKSDDPKDLAEHLRRAGFAKEQASKAAVAAASPAPAARTAAKRTPESKVVAPRPGRAAATAATRTGPTRRQVLTGTVVGALSSWFFWGWTAFSAAGVAFLSACARFMFPNVLAEPPSTIKVGLPGNFEKGEVNERWKAEWGFWIVRSDYYDGVDKLYALSTICTHLGCPPNWLSSEQKFKCPCHGSGYYVSGVNFEGPAPRPLERFKVSVGDDGQIVVDKSRKFQAELGQWEDPDSYIQA